MSIDTADAPAVRRPADRLAGPIAALALAGAVVALLVPVSPSGRSPGAVGASALSDSHPVTTPARMSRPASADHELVPRFFGFLEYDWDPGAPDGVPGFDPWPKHDPSVAETSPRN